MGGSGHNRLLKILHIDPEINWGGGEAQVLGLLENLADWGHRNDLATHPDGKLYQRSFHRSVKKIPLIVRNDLDIRAVPMLRRLIGEEQYDIVHFHTKRAHALSLWLPRGGRRPRYVVTRRMDYAEASNFRTRYFYNRSVDGVVAISQSIADVLSSAGVKHIRLIHSGIDPRPFQPATSGEKSRNEIPAVAVVAVLEERKGHRFLLQAARILKDQGRTLKYFIAGDGSHKGELEQMARTLGLMADVSFVGFVADVPGFLSSIDVLVLPSLYEGLGVAALEGMAAGKPVVASRVGGLTESIIDGQTGFLVPPGDSNALAQSIAKLLSDPIAAQEMGHAGRERVLQHFTMERMARCNEEYYYELLNGAA